MRNSYNFFCYFSKVVKTYMDNISLAPKELS